MATKQEIMDALLAQKEKSQGNSKKVQNTGDNASYPFWNIPQGSTATVRFLPDGDPNNTFFWTKREVIKLPFDGVEGGDYPTTKQVTVTVPCIDMWGESCPIIAATRPWWKDPAKEALARVYWKKKSYIFQGFVVSSPITEENPPENPIRRFIINTSIFEIIEKALMNPEFEELPIDYISGIDFRINKTQKGQYANYASSEWSRRTRSLSEDEMNAIEQYKLFNLSDYQGRRPDKDELDAIKAMFEDSVAGRPFDYASFGQYYRPYADRDADSLPLPREARSEAAEAPATPKARKVAEEAPDAAPAASGATASAQEILQRIKARTANNA